jgi:aminocarboxymuconate-semialdehyde decarboxylase
LIIIDVHTHFIPVSLAERGVGGVRLAGGEVIHRQGRGYPLHPSFHDVRARLRSMDDRRIDHAIVSVAPTFFLYSETGSSSFSKETNDLLAEHAASSAGRLTAVATLPMREPEAAAAELERAVTELGMRGAEIGPAIEGEPLDLPKFRPVLKMAERLGVPLLLHPYGVGGQDDFYLTNLVGYPLATVTSAARLILSGTLDELPSLRLVLMHGGGYLPYQIGRLDHGHLVRPEAAGCKLPPSAYLDRFCYDTITHAAAPLRFLVDMVGPVKVMYGTDHPFDMAAGPLSDQLAGTALSPEAISRIAGRNALREFGLDSARLPS